tara:strand:- start:68 stop:256 length:189 start_codon:yes stop_codon:yes gene_type:complete
MNILVSNQPFCSFFKNSKVSCAYFVKKKHRETRIKFFEMLTQDVVLKGFKVFEVSKLLRKTI